MTNDNGKDKISNDIPRDFPSQFQRPVTPTQQEDVTIFLSEFFPRFNEIIQVRKKLF
jgi:hypothetical protein